MKKTVSLTSLAIACGFAISVAAQSTYQIEKKTQSLTETKTVTATGCLQAGTEPNSFILANAVESPTSAATGTAGTPPATTPPATTPSIGAPKTFKLMTPTGIDLKAHVGHRVEVTGSWAESKMMSSEKTTSTTETTSTMKSSDQKGINVQKIRHISEKCEPSAE